MEKQSGIILKSAAFLVPVILMVGAAAVTGEREIIFPEIGAIATGLFLAPQLSWRVNGRRMFLLLLVSGVLGMGIVRFVPGSIALQMSLGYLLALVILMFSGTTFAPMVSALVLPILLQTKSVWYLISLVIFTTLLIGLRKMLEHAGLMQRELFHPAAPSETASPALILFRTAFASIMIVTALSTGWTFMAAPPILVLFTELTSPGSRALAHPGKAVLLMSLSAAAGAWIREIVTVRIAPSLLPVSVALSALLFLLILFRMRLFLPPAGAAMLFRMRLFLPPAGAAMLLAYLAPDQALTLYPLEILAGVSAYFAAALAYRAVTGRAASAAGE